VKLATFRLNGQILMCIDSPIKHSFTFTPAMSLFVDCDSEREVDELFEQLSAGGEVLMPLDAYPFSRRFGWLNDRSGVSWQLNFDAT
jgi:predicted 3-demethylubiquinone-9 3-methyltransferase (glyoxalase superfamily)